MDFRFADHATKANPLSLRLTKHPCTRSPPSTLWLDLFPIEILSRMAWYVSSGKQNNDMLNLGMASHCQKQAVVEALSYTFTVDAETPPVAREWSDIFMDDIRILDTTYQPTNFIHYYRLYPLFAAPTLRELRYNAWDIVATAYLEIVSLRKAVVHLKDDSPAWWSGNEISSTLKAEELSIVCNRDSVEPRAYPEEERCPLRRLELLPEYYSRFKAIRVKCFCPESRLWSFLQHLPHVNIKEICFSSEPLPLIYMYKRIKQVEKVRLVHNRLTWKLIPNFPENVTEVGQVEMKELSEGSTLDLCPNLEVLDCTLKNGTDMAFKLLTNTFNSLRVVKLSWVPERNNSLRERRAQESDETYKASHGAMLTLIRRAPNISQLELNQIVVDLDEQVDILKLLGARLTRFSCSILYEGERGIRYLGIVLKALRQYNPRVTSSNSQSLICSENRPFSHMVM